jgi:hypothetical protein
VALLSKSCREVYVAVQQSGKGFLLVYDLGGKQPGLLDLIKVSGVRRWWECYAGGGARVVKGTQV